MDEPTAIFTETFGVHIQFWPYKTQILSNGVDLSGILKIMVFEDDRSENPKKPWQMLQNRVSRSLTKHLPQLQLIILTVLQVFLQFRGSDELLSSDYLKQIFKICFRSPQLKTQNLPQWPKILNRVRLLVKKKLLSLSLEPF